MFRNEVIKGKIDHSHGPELDLAELLKTPSEKRRQAYQTMETPQ